MGSQPEPITRDEAGERHSRRLSGFASPAYWTEERRQKQREWAKQAIREGRFGGKPGQGGRPRNKTVTEVVADEANKNGSLIARELLSIVRSNPDPRRKIEAIDRLVSAQQTVSKDQREDERELLKMEGDELTQILLERLSELTEGAIDAESIDIPDDVSDEEIDRYLLEVGESPNGE
jgi:hypothetical protein